ncbi:inositol 2-dehydrogenase [Actinomyces sp. F1_1611]
MKIGIIGAGRIGQVHARAVAASPTAELSLIADPVPGAAEALAARYGGRATTDADEVINSDVDAVIICSPTPLHAQQVLASTRTGKAVLCEKPLAASVEEAEQLARDLEGLNPRVMVGFNRRFDPSFAAAKAAADRGELGQVEQVSIISRDPAAPPKSYIAVSGGIFKDMSIHDLDMARFLIGDIAQVSAVGLNMDPELADTGDFDGAIITLISADGKVATVTNSRHCATGYDQRLEIFGNAGSAVVDNLRPTAMALNTADVSAAREPYLDFFLDRYAEAYSLELDAFLAGVAAGTALSPSVRDGVESLRLAVACDQSARSGQVVQL